MALEKNRGRLPMPGERAVIVGAGRSGRAAAKMLRGHGVRVRLLDKNQDALSIAQKEDLLDSGVELCFGPHRPEDFSDASFVIPSPGMPIAALGEFLPKKSQAEIISEMELAWRFLDNEPVLAVTGTSGKTTTASLAAAMLKAQGYAVFLGGNIGTPLSEYILDSRKADVVVLEISSFQLQGCSTFCPRAGILLNISPNHLDYHKDMAEYMEAKFRLFRCQDEGDIAILGDDLREVVKNYVIPGREVWIQECGRFPEMKLRGRHNAINAEAAWQAARFFGVNLENAQRAVAAFNPLPHRLEKVAEINGVEYVNDSKCTTVSSLKVALESFNQPVRLLCGGKFKGGNLEGLNGLVREKVVEIALFGDSREIFEKAWQGIAPMSWHPNLEEAVKTLHSSAKPGDVALLAPATASFDLYNNYRERGDDFRRIAGELA